MAESSASEPIEAIVSTLDARGHRGFLVHNCIGGASPEGLGSRARSLIYPLVQASLRSDLIPVFNNRNLDGNKLHNYDGLDVSAFLGFDDRYSIEQLTAHSNVVELSTWTDEVYGSCCGDADAVEEMVADAAAQNDSTQPVVIVLTGAMRFVNPSASVCKWLQSRSAAWMMPRNREQGLRVAVHLRIREDWVNKAEQSINDLSHFVEALRTLRQIDSRALNGHVDVYTEKKFSEENEDQLRSEFRGIIVHRGSRETTLDDLKGLATADVLVASRSWFSAFAAYLAAPECVVVLATPECADLSGSRENYYEAHRQSNRNVYEANNPRLGGVVQQVMHTCTNRK
eukprot:TRINITY_DN26838_c0_g1_i1.p1 TRINITY_DN26838_c0_g1~~TRINITY_DN26838_c0_g1_i1.p1  ORF type:complete len:342 (-),score=51.16 TRINITY_DN26838_c0_g1_i1:74-1099(-)